MRFPLSSVGTPQLVFECEQPPAEHAQGNRPADHYRLEEYFRSAHELNGRLFGFDDIARQRHSRQRVRIASRAIES